MTDPVDETTEQEYEGLFVGGPVEGQQRVITARRGDLIPVTVGHRLPTDREVARDETIEPEVVYYRIHFNPAFDGPPWLFVYDPEAS